jgi:cyclase
LTGRPVSLVVNSHYHNDHVWGNQAFAPEATLIASAATRQLMLSAGQAEVDHYQASAAGTYEALKARYAAETDAGRRAQLAVGLGYYEALAASLPELDVHLPAVTFERRLDIYGRDGHVQLLTYADGHTGNDTILFAPAAGVVFAADLLFVGCHPYLADGDPHNLLSILDQLGHLEAAVFVPGHGPVGGSADLTTLQDYIRACLALADGLDTADEVSTTAIPSDYAAWEMPTFFGSNLRFLWQQTQQSIGG